MGCCGLDGVSAGGLCGSSLHSQGNSGGGLGFRALRVGWWCSLPMLVPARSADAWWVVPHLLRFDGQTVPAETERYLRIRPLRRRVMSMNATFTLDDAGQIHLPDTLKRVFGAKPGIRVRAEVTADRIEIVKVLPEVTEGMLEDGVLVLPRFGIKMDAAAAVQADREEQAEHALRR